MPERTILIPIPNNDFDPTEAAVPWQVLRAAGYRVLFATPDGVRGAADPLMLSGEGLDPWGMTPGLRRVRLLGLQLRADRYGRAAYRALEADEAFRKPLSYQELDPGDYDGVVLPGGHAKGVRAYLESELLQRFVAAYLGSGGSADHRPLAAICHGPVLLARSRFEDGTPVLRGRKVTALTWRLERSAWWLTRFYGRFWDPHYYRTYLEKRGEPSGYRSVEQEVRRSLANEEDFVGVPRKAPHYLRKTSGVLRDRIDDERPAWVVEDGNLITARWPGDAFTFARRFAAVMRRYYGD